MKIKKKKKIRGEGGSGWGDQGRCEQRSEVFVKIFFLGGGGSGRGGGGGGFGLLE